MLKLSFISLLVLCSCGLVDFALSEAEHAVEIEEKMMETERPPCERSQ